MNLHILFNFFNNLQLFNMPISKYYC